LVAPVSGASLEAAFGVGADDARLPVITIPTLNCELACPARALTGHNRKRVRMAALNMLCLPMAAGWPTIGAKASHNGTLRLR
jgi:hypothetical protein